MKRSNKIYNKKQLVSWQGSKNACLSMKIVAAAQKIIKKFSLKNYHFRKKWKNICWHVFVVAKVINIMKKNQQIQLEIKIVKDQELRQKIM